MEEIRELKARLANQRPVEWESLPDLNLYMDQLIGYMSRQLICSEEENLTAAMVNNYIKDGLLPRAEGKRYSRTHLAYLTQIYALKQVLPVKDAGLLARAGEDEAQVRAAYDRFRAGLDAALKDTARRLEPDTPEEGLKELALSLALRSYADKLACQRVVELIREGDPQDEGKTKKAKKEGKQHE